MPVITIKMNSWEVKIKATVCKISMHRSSHQDIKVGCTFRQMMLSGMTPRLPSVAESSVRLFPSMERFWSKGATEKACIIYRVTNTVKLVLCIQITYYVQHFILQFGALTCIFSSLSVWLAETMSAFSPLSFLCRVLLLIPPNLVMLVTETAAADAALLSHSFSRFAPSCDWKKAMWLFAAMAINRWYRYSSTLPTPIGA